MFLERGSIKRGSHKKNNNNKRCRLTAKIILAKGSLIEMEQKLRKGRASSSELSKKWLKFHLKRILLNLQKF